MRLLLGHNYYRQPGGEGVVFESEVELLRSYGHEVMTVSYTNDRFIEKTAWGQAWDSHWSQESYYRVTEIISGFKPDIAHFHNIFFGLSPSVYYACNQQGVPVVQTIHNYRLTCPAGTHYRDHRICTDCLGKKIAWPGVLHACYRNSRSQSAGVTSILAAHRLLGTFKLKVDGYLALTEFAREVLIKGGYPAEKIFVKPNFINPDPGPGEWAQTYFIFVGRLAEEKGILTLLHAWRNINGIPLLVVGDGPLSDAVERMAGLNPYVEYLGRLQRGDLFDLVRSSYMLLLPSEWYEGMPMVALEALAMGIPVMASDCGGLDEVVRDGETGVLVEPGSVSAWEQRVREIWKRPDLVRQMNLQAREAYLERHSPEKGYVNLMGVYKKFV